MGAIGTKASTAPTTPATPVLPEEPETKPEETTSEGDKEISDRMHKLIDEAQVKLDEEKDSYYNYTICTITNPNHYRLPGYTTNCAICTTAGELQNRGIDVAAGPWNESKKYSTSYVFETDLSDYDSYVAGSGNGISMTLVSGVGLKQQYENMNYYVRNPNRFSSGSKTNTNILMDAMQKWGNNSSAELTFTWKGSTSGHSVWVTNRNGKISIVDYQNGEVLTGAKQIRNYLSKTKPSSNTLVRLDHLKRRTDNIPEQNKMFGV